MQFPKLPRRPELDALRGLFILLMVMVHLPTHASDFASQPLGFASCAEGFVGLSALLVGRIYFAPLAQGQAGVRRKLWLRSLKIYGYHLLLLGFAFTVAAGFAVETHRVAILNLLHFYIGHPVVAIAGSVLLIYCPPLLDILPMYVIFLALTPVLLTAALRFGWRWVLAGSALVWAGAQFGLRSTVHHWVMHATGMRIPLQQTGAFNLFAWQAVWMAGLWLGSASALGELPLNRIPRRVIPFCAAVFVFFFMARHGWLGPHLTQGSLGMAVDKWRLGPLRVVNIACIVVVFWHLRKYLVRIISHEPLLTFGKAALQVFCAHLFFVFAGLALLYGNRLHIHGIRAVLLVLISLPALFLIAVLQVRKQHPPKKAAVLAQITRAAEPVREPAHSEAPNVQSTRSAA